MVDPLTHDVVICTRNRDRDLDTCLGSLAGQTRPPAAIRIVDASDDQHRSAVDRVIAAHAELPLIHSRAAPSTAAQRNLGVAASAAAVIHFLDDDTVLEPTYLAAIMERFEADRRPLHDPAVLLGVGGIPTGQVRPHPGALRRRLAPRTLDQGRVLRSGRGIIVTDADHDLDVDWLSGCTMSFRRDALLLERFDEGLSGYALGEDLDLGYRIRQHGRLVVTPDARLEHRESAANRWARRRWARVDVVNRRRRVASGTGHYAATAFWLDGLAQLSLWSLRALRPGAGDARAMTAGIAEGLWAARRSSDAAPGPAPWPTAPD